ncbi:MAG: alanine--tRNA ligase [Alphaproteobacteria bacterium]
MPSAKDIRQSFIDYFASRDHKEIASSSLVPRNDPSLLFTSAGMVQFKNIFTGLESPPASRAVTVQKCLRAGGKHNDLDNVGYTTRHHTFFEMMGNFSFGDYFKEAAIPYAWDLITREWGLTPERLWITIYADDDDAFELWRKVTGFGRERIIRIASSDNFWAMGDTGPCGPCSEIFYDHGEHLEGGLPGSAEGEGERFVEIWNLVFMQYERGAGGQTELPRPSIDTGIGLERISALLQGSHDNFDGDLFVPLLDAVAEHTGIAPEDSRGVSHRVIADHLRAAAFLIADDVLPSNEGRGYVLRRILRRAMRHVRLLGMEEPLLHRLLPTLLEGMGGAYPELRRAEALTGETLRLEEGRFGAALSRGLKSLELEMDALGEGGVLSGLVAFRLYDTYGFPLDLTADILRGRGFGVDTEGFASAMAEQRAAGRRAWSGSGASADSELWFKVAQETGAGEFLGYGTEFAEGVVLALVRDGKRVESAAAGTFDGGVEFVCNQTPFYAESGGQEGDRGEALGADGLEVKITDVQKHGGLHIHCGRVIGGTLRVGSEVRLRVDGERRRRLRHHHSATHLLHEALRRVLGSHVTQKGSLVAADRLRFDFSHPRAMEAEELLRVEDLVNAQIVANGEVRTRMMSPEEAMDEHGALGLFGEKYGDEVRVVSMGERDASRSLGSFSTELCGGTHVRRTGELGLFRIVNEESLSSGVRRITALAGLASLERMRLDGERLEDLSRLLRVGGEDLCLRVAALQEESKVLRAELVEVRGKLAFAGMEGRQVASSGESSNGAKSGTENSTESGAGNGAWREVGSVRLAAHCLEGVPPRELRAMIDKLKGRLGSGVAVLVAVNGGRASLVVGVTDDLTSRVDAVSLVHRGAVILGGSGGGGRADFAQAGGPLGERAEAAIAEIARVLADET